MKSTLNSYEALDQLDTTFYLLLVPIDSMSKNERIGYLLCVRRLMREFLLRFENEIFKERKDDESKAI